MNMNVEFKEINSAFDVKFQEAVITGNDDGSYSEGYDDGQKAGYNSGYTEGKIAGRTDGYKSGYAEGQSKGYADGEQAGHQAGYTEGYTEGKTDGQTEGYNTGYAEGSALKDQKPYFDTRKIKSLTGFFSQYMGNNNSYDLLKEIDTSNVKSFRAMFRGETALKTLESFDTSSATNMNSMLYGCNGLKVVSALNYSNVTDIGSCCAWCTALETISGVLDFSNVTIANDILAQCRALKNVSFADGSIKVSISLGSSSLLTIESLKSIVLGLCDFSGTENEYVYKLSLHADSQALLEAEGATAPNGLTWLEYIDSKGWNV